MKNYLLKLFTHGGMQIIRQAYDVRWFFAINNKTVYNQVSLVYKSKNKNLLDVNGNSKRNGQSFNRSFFYSIFLALLLLNFLYPVNAQNLDSLWNVWQDRNKHDTTRLNALTLFINDGYLFSKPDSALYFININYNYAKEKGLKKNMVAALFLKGTYYGNRGELKEAGTYYQESIKVAEEIGNNNVLSRPLINMGILCTNIGAYSRALDYYKRSLKISEEINDKKVIGRALYGIGTIYQMQRNDSSALDYFNRSLKYRREVNDKRGIATCLSNLGSVYSSQGKNKLAIEYFQNAIEVFEQLNDVYGLATSFNELGSAYQLIGDRVNALKCHEKALAIQQQVDNKGGMAVSLCHIGEIYFQKNEFAKGIDYCEKALDIAKNNNFLGNQKDACMCLYDSYKKIGNGKKALSYLEEMRLIEDSLNANEIAKKLDKMEFEKAMLQDSIIKTKEAQRIETAHQEEIRKKNTTRNWSIAGGMVALLLAAGFFVRWRFTRKAKAAVEKEKDRSENLLLNILPEEIAQELKEKGKAEARDFDLVTILFTDFVSFTETSEKLSATELVTEINFCFERFDQIMGKYQIEKIKTIGDAYMAAGGLPVPNDQSVRNTVLAALEMQAFIMDRHRSKEALGEPAFQMRCGLHTGPVVAGIVGVKKFQYDIWGDTVNTASRMESNGQIGRVNISQSTYELLKHNPDFTFESRGKIEVKGKGALDMWFVDFK
jgi:adenylate cyclase